MHDRERQTGGDERSRRPETEEQDVANGAGALALTSALGNAAVQRLLQVESRPAAIARQYAAPPEEGYAAPAETGGVDQSAAIAGMWEAAVVGPLNQSMTLVASGSIESLKTAFDQLQVAAGVASSVMNSQQDPAIANGAGAIFQQIQAVGAALGPHIGLTLNFQQISDAIGGAVTNATAFGAQLSAGGGGEPPGGASLSNR